jgi:DNA-binding transcriptional LysR family regulator
MWSYDDLVIFIKVIEEGNFINTAKKLDLPVSTVSRRILRLEKAINTKLINRNPRAFKPTEAGLKVFEQCSSNVSAIEQSMQRITDSAYGTGGKLTITAPVFLAQELLKDWIIEFQLKYRDIELNIFSDNRLKDLIRDDVDLALRIGPLDDSSLVAIKLWDIETSIFGSEEYLAKHPTITKPEDLYAHTCLFFRGTKEKWGFQNNRSKDIESIKPSGKFFMNDIRTIVKATEEGLGLACLPSFAVECGDNHIDSSKKLRPVLSNYTIHPERSVYAVYHDRRFLSENARLFLEHMKAKFLQLSSRKKT